MEKKNYNLVGVMSGTSMDGIDLAFLEITTMPYFSAQIIRAETQSYPASWVQKLHKAVSYNTRKLEELNAAYTQYLGEVINTFIERHQIPRDQIDAICSHGHTILHKPDKGYTLQIGNLPEIATITKCKVVCDFRVQDVTLGGQGAPLVPIGDQLLYTEYDYCLNLGGFANLSTDQRGVRIAYDICAVNTVLNVYAQKLGKGYDDRGAFAKAGTIHNPLLSKLNGLSFYTKRAPKSLGIEWVHEAVYPLIESFNLEPKDVLATYTKHISIQLLEQFKKGSKVLVTGGGAYNNHLYDLLKFDTSIDFVVPDDTLVEYKEALIFGLLGVLKLENKVNTLASVTGAIRDHSSGKIYLP